MNQYFRLVSLIVLPIFAGIWPSTINLQVIDSWLTAPAIRWRAQVVWFHGCTDVTQRVHVNANRMCNRAFGTQRAPLGRSVIEIQFRVFLWAGNRKENPRGKILEPNTTSRFRQ